MFSHLPVLGQWSTASSWSSAGATGRGKKREPSNSKWQVTNVCCSCISFVWLLYFSQVEQLEQTCYTDYIYTCHKMLHIYMCHIYTVLKVPLSKLQNGVFMLYITNDLGKIQYTGTAICLRANMV